MLLQHCASLHDIAPQIFRSFVDFQYGPGFLNQKKSLMYTFFSGYSWSRGSTPFTALNVGKKGWRSYLCPMLKLHLWEVRGLPLYTGQASGSIFVFRSLTVLFMWYLPAHACEIDLRPPQKPSRPSLVCLQMTTARVRVTLTTGSKVSDHSIHR